MRSNYDSSQALSNSAIDTLRCEKLTVRLRLSLALAFTLERPFSFSYFEVMHGCICMPSLPCSLFCKYVCILILTSEALNA